MIENEDRARLWVAVGAHRERLLRLSRSRTSTAQDAEDCVQEAMLRCMEFEDLDEARLGQFLTTVTLRLCADKHRERTKDERLRQRLGFRHREDPSHEEDVCDRGEAAWLAARFGELTARQQEVVRARETGLSCAEVANRLQMSYVSVESALARARSRFRDALAQSMGILTPTALRWSTTCVEAATAAAVVVGGTMLAPSATPGTVAGPGSRSIEAALPQAASRLGVRVEAALAANTGAPSATAITYAVTSRRVTPPVTPKKKPKYEREQIVGKPGGPGVAYVEDNYTPVERVTHCVVHGIDTSNGFRCRYPEEKEEQS